MDKVYLYKILLLRRKGTIPKTDYIIQLHKSFVIIMNEKVNFE